ncbi:hypothetical protein [Thioalkalivibrio sp. ARh3]|uniref:hypothetical protein n=1 Tax=Thioalkalivibrio sp. ARh3 TaxID=1158148 RepID=UPI00036DCFD8|nr:hypothetical protein [Thioalkalivibrio sp. ARh3]
MKADAKVNWRPHTERPDAERPFSAVLAYADDIFGHCLSGKLWTWQPSKGRWVSEAGDLMLVSESFWWLPEEELLSTVPKETAHAD